MALESIPIQSIWRFLRWLPSVLLRWYFTKAKLEQLIYVDIRPRHSSVVIDLGESTSFSIYLMIINLSPFPIELDRAGFKFWLGGSAMDVSILKKQIIVPGENASLYLGGIIPEGAANQFARHSDNPVVLDGNIEFNCYVRSFAKNIGRLDGIYPLIHNSDARQGG